MTMDKDKSETVGPEAQDACQLQSSCCRRGKKCCCRWLLVLLLLILLGGGAIYWSLFTRVLHLDVVQTAMQEIRADKGLRSDLGQPIEVFGWRPPSARIESTEKDVRWNIAGPKGEAKAHVSARLMQGKWEIVQLEVTLPNGKRMSIAGSGDSDAEAPRYEAPKAGTKKTEPNMPAPEINLPIPSGGAPEK
jgi:hypothetical protein